MAWDAVELYPAGLELHEYVSPPTVDEPIGAPEPEQMDLLFPAKAFGILFTVITT